MNIAIARKEVAKETAGLEAASQIESGHDLLHMEPRHEENGGTKEMREGGEAADIDIKVDVSSLLLFSPSLRNAFTPGNTSEVVFPLSRQ